MTMATETTPARNDALARASALANRARELRRAQAEVQALTAREVQVLARTAARFFDSIPLVEFTPTLLPQSARGLRRIRHRILHRTIHNTAMGTLIRALLLGRDGNLRLFSARSADSRDLLLIMEPGRSLPVGVMRDVVDWTPMLRVPGFRPFEILDRLSHSLDAVEEQIADAERRVQVQRAALTSGDLTALLPSAAVAAMDDALPPVEVMVASPVGAPMIAASSSPAPFEGTSPSVASAPDAGRDPFDMFELVEAVAASRDVHPADLTRREATSAHVTPVPSAPVDPRFDPAADAEEWDEPVEPAPATPVAPTLKSLFPPMPAPCA
ncbi:MAG: hypothetical protein U5K74_07865 [Gemmatimonadaceae bacterium]|nr:hypothetical protein [Gemmatimonadaceae bacterium]